MRDTGSALSGHVLLYWSARGILLSPSHPRKRLCASFRTRPCTRSAAVTWRGPFAARRLARWCVRGLTLTNVTKLGQRSTRAKLRDHLHILEQPTSQAVLEPSAREGHR